ncbi:DUF938 domain-containing protein [Roseobacter weihaiensis]|uniref:DUF938 domain-containing protein n=1 Tax=Roseobacter weihaiensis TaxID=2763262 RepID=UPI001D09F42F|nr:DUF938 domain-containing protein [Roseobacter sp. H9]
MTGKLPTSASVLAPGEGAKLHAPAAERNGEVLCDLLCRHAPRRGQALEIASGTGQHVVQFARALPGLTWQPTEIDAERRASIDAYGAEAALPNLLPAVPLDASQAGWHKRHGAQSLIVLVNLLHLISTPQARVLIEEAVHALAPEGRFVLYGPFMRAGQLTSAGDLRFHAQLAEADPAIGYKNDADIREWLLGAGVREVVGIEMPANNLAFVASR